MDRLDAMSVLVTAVEAGSLSAAARRLDMPLATVSRKVAELEAHLKTRLLNRSSRQFALTDAGRSYVTACRHILEVVGEAERTAAGEYRAPKGELILTAPIVFGRLHVLPVVIAFLKAYPEIDIRLVLADRMVNLLEDHIDLAVRIGELPDSSLVATRVGTIRRIVCASPAYLAEHGTPEHPDHLAAHHCISFVGLVAPDAWTFPTGPTVASVPVHSRLVVNTAEAAIDAATAGLGVTRLLSYQVATALRGGTLRAILQSFEPAPVPVTLVFTEARLVPLKLRAFLDFATPRLKAVLTELAP
ncbi:MAG: LysR family transcriptional regulator [Azospirillum sp.]|nr:LysR family transcriptional regulator [Azospirillum sp.]